MQKDILTQAQVIVIIKEIIEYFKDLYRIWLREKREIGVRYIREKPALGVIQCKLILAEKFLKRLKKLILYLNQNPHIGINYERKFLNLYEVEEVSDDTLWSYILLKNRESNLILAPQKKITSNIYENRWVKGFLLILIREMNRCIKEIENYEEKYKIEEYKNKLEEIKEKIEDEKRKIFPLLYLDFLNEIEPQFELKPTSVIKYNPLYNQIYRLYLEFNSFYLPCDMHSLNMGSLDEWYLYELWVFLKIFKQCREKFGENFKIINFFEEENGRIKLKIGELEEEKGQNAYIRWENGWELHYQKYFSTNERVGSYTEGVKPDVVIIDDKKNYYIFDAKEMLIKDLFREKGRNAIAQIHMYKECIKDLKTKENVVKGGYIVAPDISYEKKKYFDNEWRKEWGFGILIFQPDGKIDNIFEILE